MVQRSASGLALALAILLACCGGAAQAQDCISPSPHTAPVKIVNIKNNTGKPIWAVLETAKQDLLDNQNRPHDRWLQAEFHPTPGTYASTYLYRAYVNPDTGIKERSAVSVIVPFYTRLEATPCPFQADQYINWWRALRIYIYDDPGAIKNAHDTDRRNAVVVTPPAAGAVPSCATCAPMVVYRDQSGTDGHGVSLPANDPSQLLEFTFATVTPFDPLKPLDPPVIDHGFVDYDISSVDQVYLPVAMDPVNNPYIGFIGSIMERDQFNERLGLFKQDFDWPVYKWPAYVSDQEKLRLPATFNVMNEIAHPGAPPPFVPAGAAIKALPVIQAMERLWDTCCGAGWPQSSPTCTKPVPSTATCDKMAQVADLFQKNYAHYASLCAAPAARTRDLMMAHVYGWVPFKTCPSGDVGNELLDTPGIGGAAGYHAIANAYIDLQYNVPPNPPTYGDFNRYVQLIHAEKYLRVGEYAFSIDDAAGNMLEVGDGVNITVGGAPGLGNTNPYDPWRFFMFNVGAADQAGILWTKYRICTADDGSSCPSQPPDRDMKEADRTGGTVGYAGIKVGAVRCPCVIVLQDSQNTRYKVVVNRLPAPPPVHPLDKEGDPPSTDDDLWDQKAGDAYSVVACYDDETIFDWCRNLTPVKQFDDKTQRMVYHVNTAAPMAVKSGIRFEPGDLSVALAGDQKSVTVKWPKAITQPPGRQVTYELTLWDRANCPRDAGECNGHAYIPLADACDKSSTSCRLVLASLVGPPPPPPPQPLTSSTLKSVSVVAKDPDNNVAQKETNFTPPLGGPPPLAGEIRSGTATGVGLAPAADGSGKGRVKISGVFTFSGALDLGARGATVTILNGLHEAGGAGEMVLDSELALVADGRNTARTARFKTAPGERPAGTVTIGSRGRGQYTLTVDISGAVIDLPTACPQPVITTSIEVNDGVNPPFVLDIEQPWQCVQRGRRVESLKTP